MFSKKPEQITLAGSILLVIGAFAPMINIGRLGTVSYADAASPDVYVLLIAGLATSAFVALGKQKLAPVAAIVAWGVLLWPMLKNMGSSGDDGGLLGKVVKTVTDPLKDLAGNLFGNILEFEWGGYVFLLGLCLLTAGSVMVFLESRKA